MVIFLGKKIIRWRLIYWKSGTLRHLDPIHSELSNLNKTVTILKNTLEEEVEKIENVNKFIGEVLTKVNMNHQETVDRVKAQSQTLGPMKEAINATQTKVVTAINLLKDASQV